MSDNDQSNFRTIDDVRFQKLWTGISGRIIEGERITVAVVELEPNGTVPSHQHEHEQMGIVIRGQVTFTVGDETRTFGPGGTWRVPSMTPHGALTGPDGATGRRRLQPDPRGLASGADRRGGRASLAMSRRAR